uniref:DUF541 domain-containing protein n=1 Tax=uncultured Armatimonadetes bacterium TaxID=157466 RepID=A0A6J4J8N6_9BACT|nr:hypothetical protein AVDCRST_MAG63-3122 [uncultured Armatimonadetes bacterium]
MSTSIRDRVRATAALLAVTVAAVPPAGAQDNRQQLDRIEASLAQMKPEETVIPGLTVQGRGEVKITPDVARILLGVSSRGADGERVARDNAAAMRRVIDAVKRAGVEQKDIQTRKVALTPQYGQGGFGGGGRSFYRRRVASAPARAFNGTPAAGEPAAPRYPAVNGYEATSTLRISVRQLNDVGKVLAAASKAVPNVASTYFFDVDPVAAATARKDALREAVADAMEKARTVAEAAGVQPGEVRLIGVSLGKNTFESWIEASVRNQEAAGPFNHVNSGPPQEQSLVITVTARFTMPPLPLGTP